MCSQPVCIPSSLQMLSLGINYIFLSRGCARSESNTVQVAWDAVRAGLQDSLRGLGVGDAGNERVTWDGLTLPSTVEPRHCAPSSPCCLECPHSWVPGIPPGSWKKPVSGCVSCPCVPEPSVTAIPRNNNLVSLIMALRPKLIDARVFLISKNACYRKMLHKLQFRRGESTQRVLIWPKWQIPDRPDPGTARRTDCSHRQRLIKTKYCTDHCDLREHTKCPILFVFLKISVFGSFFSFLILTWWYYAHWFQRKRKGRRERGRECRCKKGTLVGCLSRAPRWGTKLAVQSNALTGTFGLAGPRRPGPVSGSWFTASAQIVWYLLCGPQA